MSLFDRPIGRDTYAMIRYGFGWPARGAPLDAAAMLDRLGAADTVKNRFPQPGFAEMAVLGQKFYETRFEMRKDIAGAQDRYKAASQEIRAAFLGGLATDLARMADTDDPFRERLVQFWRNHFATRADNRPAQAAAVSYVDEAIRPHVTGRFADMLKAAVTHPVMLVFLDQHNSIGPHSKAGLRSGRGMNENLARELMELHTLGVGAGYTQADVVQLAELLTGLAFNIRRSDAMRFRPEWAEPGAETVLGRSYGGADPAALADISAVLEDLAVHPSTAGHLSRKIAVHFVADVPDDALVAAMTGAWTRTGGDLMAVMTAMLDHPAAWTGFGAKVKTPLEFVGSAVRALGFDGAQIAGLKDGRIAGDFLLELRGMGQNYDGPPGPDGFPDEAQAWVQPFGLAQRITWAMRIVRRSEWRQGDPSEFARAALGDAASTRLVHAVGGAETRAEGVGIVLASAEFNRR